MRAGRKRTLLSWTTYTKGEVEHAGDAREGLWSHAQLEAMDQKFCRAVERAFRRPGRATGDINIGATAAFAKSWRRRELKGVEGAAAGSIQNGPRRLRPIKGLQWQTLVRGDIGRQRLFRPVANPSEVEARCVFRALMRYEVKQHEFKMFEGDP
jgi:hypothetical protein